MMTSADVIELHTDLTAVGIELWIDGGWAVDALLGRQTRPHDDLDVVVQQKDLSALRRYLSSRGYVDVPRDDTRAWNFVLGDGRGREVDVHVIVFDGSGNGRYGPIEDGIMYPAVSLEGQGHIGGRAVRCISPEWLVKFHSGYELKEKDFSDVAALCERFGLANPLADNSDCSGP